MIQLLSCCPRSDKIARSRFLDFVADVARWSERAGCYGIVVPAAASAVDPWMLAHTIVRNTTTLCPVISVLPAYSHPYWVAKQAASFAFLHGRPHGLNIVAESEGDPHPAEFAAALRRILRNPAASEVKAGPPLPPKLRPDIMLPGSSVWVGVIARESSDHAWSIARSRFPCERRRVDEANAHWTTPQRDYDACVPYLVGSYDAVARELDRDLAAGCRRFVVDVPMDPEELDHVQIAFARTATLTASAPPEEAAAAS